MINLKPYKNTYGHPRVDCPFCGYDAKFRGPGFNDLKRHITNQAKNEALELIVAGKGEIAKYKHLEYYKKHTSNTVTITIPMRKFDDSFKIK